MPKQDALTIKKQLQKRQELALIKHQLIDRKQNEYIQDWVDKHGVDSLSNFIKTYYILSKFNKIVCEIGLRQFFVSAYCTKDTHCKTYLIDCCKTLGNKKLTKLCQKAIDLDKQYNITENKYLSAQCLSKLIELDKQLMNFDRKYCLDGLLDNFLINNYSKNNNEQDKSVQASYTKRFIMSISPSTDYDIYNEWYADTFCEQDTETKNNPTLYGAYIAICYHNEVCNGGIDQFWDFAEDYNWDLDEIARLFETLLPKDMYELYLKAVQMHRAGQDCEELNRKYDYDKMSKEVLPQLATKVGDYYRQLASK